MAVSDILLREGVVLDERIRGSVAMWVGCIAGACWGGMYEEWLKGAEFEGMLLPSPFLLLNPCHFSG